ncbi:MAG: RNA polymerase sigma factor [Pirellulaceae bacterium]
MTLIRSDVLEYHLANPVALATGLAYFRQPAVNVWGSEPPVAKDLDDIRRSLDGDGDGYRNIVERHEATVGAMMWKFSRDPVVHKDLVQDVFVEAYRSLHSFKGKAPFAHWLARIATRVGYKYWRQRARESETVPLEEWDGASDLASEPESLDPEQAGRILHRFLAELAPRDRLVLTLRYLEDKDVAETAALTGWTQTMVKVQAHRAKKKLKALMERRESYDYG